MFSKKITVILCLVLLAVVAFAGCSKTPTSLEVEGYTQIYELGQDFSAEGLVVNGIFDDNSTEMLDLSKCTVDSSNYNKNVAGTYQIKVTYKKIETTFSVKVQNQQYALNVTASAGGSVEGDGQKPAGETVTLTAVIQDNYDFNGWFDGSVKVCSALDYTFEMPAEAVTLQAQFVNVGEATQGLRFTKNADGKTCVLSNLGTATATNIVIPAMYDGTVVTSIAGNAFGNKSAILSIRVPSAVTKIGNSAFVGCEALTSIDFGTNSNLVTIGNEVFKNCFALSNIQIPSSVTSIGTSAFLYCSALESVSIPSGVTVVEENLFQLCAKLSQVTFAEDCKVSAIKQSAFNGCVALTSIEIPDSVTSIGGNAFFGCSTLEEVYISSLTVWCNITFERDNANPMSFGVSIFVGTQKLEEATLPEGITAIKDFAFYGSTDLLSVSMPSTVTIVGLEAFKNCTNLATLVLSDSLTTIEESAFEGCTSLASLVLPTGLTTIGTKAFYECTGLTSVSFPSSLATLGESVFANCSALKTITFAQNSVLTIISKGTFYYCSALEKADLKNLTALTTIGEDSFRGCTSMSSIVIPENVTAIQDGAFGMRNSTLPGYCVSLIEIINHSQLRIEDAFSGAYGAITTYALFIKSGPDAVSGLFVDQQGFYCYKDSSLSQYYVLGYKGVDTDTIVFPEQVDGHDYEIYKNAFYSDETIKSVVIPNGVTAIGEMAFVNCTNLSSVTFGANSRLGSIAINTFANCTALTEINLPTGITEISENSFSGSGLTKIDLSQLSVTAIEAMSFADCKDLNEVILPNTLVTIGERAFRGCSALMSIIIPQSVTTIEENAFGDCLSLIEIYNLSSLTITKGSTTNGGIALNALEVYTSMEQESKVVKQGDFLLYVSSSEEGSAILGYSGSATAIQLPDTIDGHNYVIWTNAFANNDTIVSVLIPAAVTEIGVSAFYRCTKLTTVTFGENSNLTKIGNDAFNSCSALKQITIPASVTTIGTSAFSFTALTEINLTQCTQLTNIATSTFSGCKVLKKVLLPNSVTSIGQQAFSGCFALTSFTVPTSLTNIGRRAFNECYKLVEIYNLSSLAIAKGAENYGGIAYYSLDVYTSLDSVSKLKASGDFTVYADATNQLYYLISYNGVATTITLPQDIDGKDYVIYSYAFYGASIVSVTISASVTTIQTYAFYACADLTTVTFAANSKLDLIEDAAFANCTALTTFVVPASVTSIGSAVFWGCDRLTSVTFEDSANWMQTSNSTGWRDKTGGTAVDVSNPESNVGILNSRGQGWDNRPRWYKAPATQPI